MDKKNYREAEGLQKDVLTTRRLGRHIKIQNIDTNRSKHLYFSFENIENTLFCTPLKWSEFRVLHYTLLVKMYSTFWFTTTYFTGLLSTAINLEQFALILSVLYTSLELGTSKYICSYHEIGVCIVISYNEV